VITHFGLVGGNIEARLFRHTGDDFLKYREFLVDVILIAQSTI
jgi:hypothetical protein